MRSSLNKYKGIEFIASIFPTVISTEENKLKKEPVETKHASEKNLRVNSEIKNENETRLYIIYWTLPHYF